MKTKKIQRRQYTEDFKRQAMALVTEQGYKVSQAARSLDINPNLITNWRRQFEQEGCGNRPPDWFTIPISRPFIFILLSFT